jgi:hypothetical protein
MRVCWGTSHGTFNESLVRDLAMFKVKIATAAAIGLLLQAQAFAGIYTGSSVTVSGNTASGSVYQTRYSGNSTEGIGCYIGAYVANADITNTSANVYLSCSATNSSGTSYSCYVNNPPAAWITMMSSINQVSWIYFYGDSQGHCQGLNVEQNSNNL